MNGTVSDLSEKLVAAAKTSLGSKFSLVKVYVRQEMEALAQTLELIIQAAAAGEISEAEAKVLLRQQRLAAESVLIAAEGMSVVAVQAAINDALDAVKDAVNGKIGFPLL